MNLKRGWQPYQWELEEDRIGELEKRFRDAKD